LEGPSPHSLGADRPPWLGGQLWLLLVGEEDPPPPELWPGEGSYPPPEQEDLTDLDGQKKIMDPQGVEINLNGYLKGEFNLNSLRMGYRYSPWEERDGEFHQGILCNGKMVKAILKCKKGRLLLRLESNSMLSPREITGVGGKVADCLGLRDDLSPLSLLAKRDTNLKRALLALPGYRLKSPPTLYETIISAMLSQNCSA